MKMVMKTRIRNNRVRCLECYTLLESKHVHDYRTCGCPNQASVDGGRDYAHVGAVDMDKIEILTEYGESAGSFTWTTLDGETLFLEEITDSHLQNIALHIRDRIKAVNEQALEVRKDVKNDEKYHINYAKANQSLLDNVFLPELERRGLKEVTEEIPWRKEE